MDSEDINNNWNYTKVEIVGRLDIIIKLGSEEELMAVIDKVENFPFDVVRDEIIKLGVPVEYLPKEPRIIRIGSDRFYRLNAPKWAKKAAAFYEYDDRIKKDVIFFKLSSLIDDNWKTTLLHEYIHTLSFELGASKRSPERKTVHSWIDKGVSFQLIEGFTEYITAIVSERIGLDYHNKFYSWGMVLKAHLITSIVGKDLFFSSFFNGTENDLEIVRQKFNAQLGENKFEPFFKEASGKRGEYSDLYLVMITINLNHCILLIRIMKELNLPVDHYIMEADILGLFYMIKRIEIDGELIGFIYKDQTSVIIAEIPKRLDDFSYVIIDVITNSRYIREFEGRWPYPIEESINYCRECKMNGESAVFTVHSKKISEILLHDESSLEMTNELVDDINRAFDEEVGCHI